MAVKQHEENEVSFAAVDSKQSDKNRKVLQPILTDLIAFERILKQLHWNVVGPHFRAVHLHLDEIYALTITSIDEVAERISATGHSPNGRTADVAKNTELDDVPEGFMRDDEVLLHAERRIKHLAELIRARMADIEDADTVTADLLHAIVAGLEKHHWMLQAQRV